MAQEAKLVDIVHRQESHDVLGDNWLGLSLMGLATGYWQTQWLAQSAGFPRICEGFLPYFFPDTFEGNDPMEARENWR